ncbi:MAG TPA: cation:proton antiporter [Polyangiaceae bacterium]|nr:cation:proton antiporter [Polyangiaceae bacterium]
MDAHGFLEALSIVLGVAAVTTVLFQRLRQPVVLGYILAGFIIGPNVPVPLVADRQVIETLSELGVILLMFSLGLEFSLGKLVRLGPSAGLTALLQSSLMIWLGFVTGRLFGWSTLESLFAGAIIAISSTTIIAKAFDEQRIQGPLRELVVGVLIIEDLIAILLMATLTAIASGAGLSATEMALTSGKLLLFLLGLIAIGLLVVPRTVRFVQRLGRPETTLVASIGFCFAIALLAHEVGYSVALGAFIAGSLIAESGQQQEIEHLVAPVRDLFAAIFFVSVGVLIDPVWIARHWFAITALTAVVISGKVLGVSLGAFLTGNRVRTSVQAGMSLAQIGEFSFIIAGLGLSLGATGDFLYPVAVAVSAITTLTTPWLIRASGPAANWVDRKMPRPLQTFVTLYGGWMEQLRSGNRPQTRGTELRRLVRLLLLDAALLGATTIGASFAVAPVTELLEGRFALGAGAARMGVIAAALVVVLPLVAGVVRVARRLGVGIAEAVLAPVEPGTADPGAASRRLLAATLQLGLTLLAGLILLALTQPFVGGVVAPLLLGLLLAVLGADFWRGAADLHGHVRAGAQTIFDVIVDQARSGGADGGAPEPPAPIFSPGPLLLPGLGVPTLVQLEPPHAAVGRSLASLNLRGVTGATVLAITRPDQGVVLPTAKDPLRAGDVLALAGSTEAIEAARQVLRGAATAGHPSS